MNTAFCLFWSPSMIVTVKMNHAVRFNNKNTEKLVTLVHTPDSLDQVWLNRIIC